MVEIEEMLAKDVREVLARIGYGHLACCEGDEPYVVPIHYAFNGEDVYIYTTEGKKSEILRKNSKICLQAEEVESNENWTSVMVFGEAAQLVDEDKRQEALALILKGNPRLTPAISIRWMDSWVRENVEAIYRIRVRSLSGRRTVNRKNRSEAMLTKSRTD
jgi:uncharacterized protein